jgi:hypothetical protein
MASAKILVAVRLDPHQVAQVDALIPVLSTPWHPATGSDALRAVVIHPRAEDPSSQPGRAPRSVGASAHQVGVPLPGRPKAGEGRRILGVMKRIRSLALVTLLSIASCEPPREPTAVPVAPHEGVPAVVTIPAASPEPAPAPAAEAEPELPLAPTEAEPEPPAPEAAAAVAAPQALAPAGGATPLGALLRDTRKVRLTPRAQQLLVVEIQGLEMLFANTPKSSSDRPKLLRRVAETYVELEAAAQRSAAQAGTPPASNLAKVTAAARTAAIKHYQMLWSQYPGWCAVPSPAGGRGSGCADEALYYGGYEDELAGLADERRKRYLELIQGFPQSRLVPFAYLGFGEMFFDEARNDPSKLILARQSYEEVLKYPQAQNDVHGYAQYQLGRVFAALGDRARPRGRGARQRPPTPAALSEGACPCPAPPFAVVLASAERGGPLAEQHLPLGGEQGDAGA